MNQKKIEMNAANLLKILEPIPSKEWIPRRYIDGVRLIGNIALSLQILVVIGIIILLISTLCK